MLPIRCSRLCFIIALILVVLVFLSTTLSVVESGYPTLKKSKMPFGSHFPRPLLSNSKSSVANVEDDAQRVNKETTIPKGAHTAGFTVLDDLYLKNGTFYIVTKDASAFPSRENLISRPLDKGNKNLKPTDQELQFLSISRVQEMLGNHAMRISGFSIIVYDAVQFMPHYYHWWGEIVLGAWRVYSKLSKNGSGTISRLPPPVRIILPVVENETWRDAAGVDGPLIQAAFPGVSLEGAGYWQDLMKLNATVVFDRAMIVNRVAAHRDPSIRRWYKMISSTMSIIPPTTFWEPVQQSVVRNILGYIPKMNEQGAIISPPQVESNRPIVTYISRQGSRRRLLPEDHAGLVAALKELQDQGICDVKIVLMERMSLREQIEVVAKSTIIVGVHGNGLTHQLWMPSSSRSTVIEIVYPPGYPFDYEILARNMGHRHYVVHNDTLLTYPAGTYHHEVNMGPGFHGDRIPVYGSAVAQTIKQRLLEDTRIPRAGSICSPDGEQRCL